MPRIAYTGMPNFRRSTLEIIELADKICTDYQRQGYNLTLRQLYYQFISRDFFPNSEKSYDKLGRIVNDARLAGMIDWSHLTDRGREAHSVGWLGINEPDPADLVENAAGGYAFDLWRSQPRRVEVWVEKQALEDVVARAAHKTRSGYFACKGYVSQSEMWGAGQRLQSYIDNGHTPLILHLGDHDPSGIDMTRDIGERLEMFVGEPVEVRRLALNMDQVDEYNPPPNPAKVSDSRFETYAATYGNESWELDALKPEMLVDLIANEITSELDQGAWHHELLLEQQGRAKMRHVASHWAEALEFIEREFGEEG